MKVFVAGRLQENEETEMKVHGVDALLLIPVNVMRPAAPLWTLMTLLKKPVNYDLILMKFEERKLLDAVVFVVCVVCVVCVVWTMGKSGGPNLIRVKN